MHEYIMHKYIYAYKYIHTQVISKVAELNSASYSEAFAWCTSMKGPNHPLHTARALGSCVGGKGGGGEGGVLGWGGGGGGGGWPNLAV